jgi:hypothetical protein
MAFQSEQETAKQLHKKVRIDTGKGYHLPNEQAVHEAATAGTGTGADLRPEPEDFEKMADDMNIAEPRGQTRTPRNEGRGVLGTGGGLSGMDQFANQGLNIDPELRHLATAFLAAQRAGETRGFEDWLNDGHKTEKKAKRKKGRTTSSIQEDDPNAMEEYKGKKETEKSDPFDLKIDKKKAAELSPAQAGELEDFWAVMTKSDKDSPRSLTLLRQGDVFVGMSVTVGDETQSVSMDTAVRAVKGLNAMREQGTAKIIGIKFGTKVQEDFVFPGTEPRYLKDVFGKIKFDGVGSDSAFDIKIEDSTGDFTENKRSVSGSETRGQKSKEVKESADGQGLFELTVDDKKLVEKDDGSGREFVEAFGDDVTELALLTRKQQGVEEIAAFRITLKDGTTRRISSIVLRGIFPRVRSFKDGVGFILEDTAGKKKMVFPGTPEALKAANERTGRNESLSTIMHRIRINGKSMNPDAEVVMMPEGETKQVTEERGPYVEGPYPQDRVNPHPGADTI